MLSDSIKLLSARFAADADAAWLLLTLRVFELEARNMEDRIQSLTGRPHVALDGGLITPPAYGLETNEAHHA